MAVEMIMSAELQQKFWSYVDKRSDCWRWTRSFGTHGYGLFYAPNKVQVLAHRFALATREEPPNEGAFALHDCDNKWCVNPSHLHWGTQQDNMREAAERGLSKSGRTLGESCPSGHRYTPGNILTSRRKGPHGKVYTVHSCRECNRLYLARRRADKKEKAA